jgi:Na+-transporting methylmalonyl-CoA/oxaloacetate decarboxylase gamma subunit
MKISKYIWLLFIIGLYVLNYFWLKINLWTYTGMVLGILVILVVAINIIIKIKNRKGKTDENFIFSEKTANIIKAVDMSTQYEASILSLFCLIIGMVLFMIYVIFIAPYTLFFKIFISLNTLFGIGLMGSMLVTNYQQFISYKESRKMLLDFSNQFGTEILSPDKLKPGKILIPLEANKPEQETNNK